MIIAYLHTWHSMRNCQKLPILMGCNRSGEILEVERFVPQICSMFSELLNLYEQNQKLFELFEHFPVLILVTIMNQEWSHQVENSDSSHRANCPQCIWGHVQKQDDPSTSNPYKPIDVQHPSTCELNMHANSQKPNKSQNFWLGNPYPKLCPWALSMDLGLGLDLRKAILLLDA